MRFAPSQGLPIALTQYAPGKQVWISGKCYVSGAVYSVMADERYEAWDTKRLYSECSACGFAKTFEIGEIGRGEKQDCPACGSERTFGEARYWLRPPGFAHPIDVEEVTSPDDMPETSYATRAKLTMQTPPDADRAVFKWEPGRRGRNPLLFQILIPDAGLGSNVDAQRVPDLVSLPRPSESEILVLSVYLAPSAAAVHIDSPAVILDSWTIPAGETIHITRHVDHRASRT